MKKDKPHPKSNILSYMTTISHVAVGVIVTRYFIEHGILPKYGIAPYVLGITFANIPDIDGLISLKRIYDHHNTLKNMTHYPANWLFVLGFTALLGLFIHIPNFYNYLALVSINVFLHFVLDTFSIYGGIAWFGPWNKKKYSFIKILPYVPSNTHEWIHWYMKHWIVYMEIALWIIAALIIAHQFIQ